MSTNGNTGKAGKTQVLLPVFNNIATGRHILRNYPDLPAEKELNHRLNKPRRYLLEKNSS
jgi:hypothetical protein